MSAVLIAPVPAEVLVSAIAHPRLRTEVAFGTRQRDMTVATGVAIYIYAAPDGSPYRSLFRPNCIAWTGTLGRMTPAVAQGVRRGMHPDASVRPPFAESYDYRDAAMFWHVLGLRPLDAPIPFDRFRDVDGAKLFGNGAPRWIASGFLHAETAPASLPRAA